MIKLKENAKEFELWCNAIARQFDKPHYDQPLSDELVGDILSVCFHITAGEPCDTFAEHGEYHRELAALINQEIHG